MRTLLNGASLSHSSLILSFSVLTFDCLSFGSLITSDSLPGLAVLPLLVCHKSVTDPSILRGESYVDSCG